MGEVDRADNSACCEGCGSMRTTKSLKADGYISCCPERKMVPVREWRRRALDAELATRTSPEAVLVEALEELLTLCEAADEADDLPDTVTGDAMFKARQALASAKRGG